MVQKACNEKSEHVLKLMKYILLTDKNCLEKGKLRRKQDQLREQNISMVVQVLIVKFLLLLEQVSEATSV